MHLRLSAREIDENRLLPDLTTHQSSPSIIDASHQSTQKAKTINGSGPSVNSSPTIPEMDATSTMDGMSPLALITQGNGAVTLVGWHGLQGSRWLLARLPMSSKTRPRLTRLECAEIKSGSLSFICHHEAHVSLRHVSSCLSTMRSRMGTRDNQVIHAQ
jgi:hypothetical protein